MTKLIASLAAYIQDEADPFDIAYLLLTLHQKGMDGEMLCGKGTARGEIERIIESIEEAIQEEESEGTLCSSCNGSGIGRFGDPLTSICTACNGGGVSRHNNDDEDDPN